MSITKRFDGDYNLTSLTKTIANNDPNATTFTFDTNLVRITGDMLVQGEATFVDKSDVTISDNTIILNDGEVGTGVTLGYSGLQVDRGTANAADILYQESTNKWTVDLGDTIRQEVLTALPGAGTVLFNVVEDITPQLGGDLDVNDFSITATASNNIGLEVTGGGQIVLSGPVMIAGDAPASVLAGEVGLFSDVDTGGGSKLHFKNDTDTGELISKNKAIVFALIF